MSDLQTPTPATPAATPAATVGAGGQQPTTPAGQQAQAQPAPSPTPTAGEPFRTFATQQELEGFVTDRARRAERAGIRNLAKEFGFDDPEDFKDAIKQLRGANGGAANGSQTQPGTQPATNASQAPNDGARLNMAIKVAAELGLPATLIGRLQGSTEEEMKADAQSLQTLLVGGGSAANPAPATPTVPGVPPVPSNNQPVTITRSWMRANPEWVRKNRAAVEQAAKEGRIVNS